MNALAEGSSIQHRIVHEGTGGKGKCFFAIVSPFAEVKGIQNDSTFQAAADDSLYARGGALKSSP